MQALCEAPWTAASFAELVQSSVNGRDASSRETAGPSLVDPRSARRLALAEAQRLVPPPAMLTTSSVLSRGDSVTWTNAGTVGDAELPSRDGNLVVLFVYLDQNKWIDLAKAESGKPDGKRFSAVLSAARDAARAGRATFPISATHVKETASAPRRDQRETLARLMAELSQGVVLRTPRPMVEHGIRQALRRTFGLPLLDEELSVFGRGIEQAFGFNLADLLPGRSPELIELLRDHIDSSTAWIDLLTHADEKTRKVTVEHLKAISTNFAVGRQDDRQLLSDSDRAEVRKVFMARVTLHFRDALQGSLAEIERTMEEWGASGPDKLVEFWQGIACVRVLVALEECLHFETSKVWNANDLHDLEFLSLAIPYCDAIVADKFWIHHAKIRTLDAEFHTTLLTDLTQLEETLSAAT